MTRRGVLKQVPLAGLAGAWIAGSGRYPGMMAGGECAAAAVRGTDCYGILLRAGFPYPPRWAARVEGRRWTTVGAALRAAGGRRYPCRIFAIDDLETHPADAVASQGGR